ncbi:MAG: hypothetical protein R3E08_04600 [Thiotrichaceae bacterium]
MKLCKIIVLFASVVSFSAQAEEGIGREQAIQSFQNNLSSQHKMQHLLGSPKFDSIGAQTTEDEEPIEPEEATLPKSNSEDKSTATSPNLKVGKIQAFSGRIAKVEWQKSSASYCQGGSTYYELVVGDKHYTLNSLRDPVNEADTATFDKLQAVLEKLTGRTITLNGQLVSRHFTEQEQCPNPAMQCMAGEITCEWLRVTGLVIK